MTPVAPSLLRCTLAAPAAIEGLTLFTGILSKLTIRPALAGEGITFLRTDAPGSGLIEARVDSISTEPQPRRTVLANAANRHTGSVQTVEHLLAALAGLRITDALIELFGPELPIGDGSAKLFTDAIIAAGGIKPLDPACTSPLPPLAIVREPITLSFPDGSSLSALPHDRPEALYTYHLAYPPGCGIEPPTQSASFAIPLHDLDHDGFAALAERFASDIAPARTFSLAAEAKAAQAMGLFKHLTTKDMLVIGPSGPIDNVFRFPNEPARHKLLDLIGDLSLCARPIQAHIVATRTGHAHNHEMARRLAALP